MTDELHAKVEPADNDSVRYLYQDLPNGDWVEATIHRSRFGWGVTYITFGPDRPSLREGYPPEPGRASEWEKYDFSFWYERAVRKANSTLLKEARDAAKAADAEAAAAAYDEEEGW